MRYIYIYIYVEGHVAELASTYTQSVWDLREKKVQIAGVKEKRFKLQD